MTERYYALCAARADILLYNYVTCMRIANANSIISLFLSFASISITQPSECIYICIAAYFLSSHIFKINKYICSHYLFFKYNFTLRAHVFLVASIYEFYSALFHISPACSLLSYKIIIILSSLYMRQSKQIEILQHYLYEQFAWFSTALCVWYLDWS